MLGQANLKSFRVIGMYFKENQWIILLFCRLWRCMGMLVMFDLEYRFTRLILKHSLFLPLLNLREHFLLHNFLSQFSDAEVFGILLHSKKDRMFRWLLAVFHSSVFTYRND